MEITHVKTKGQPFSPCESRIINIIRPDLAIPSTVFEAVHKKTEQTSRHYEIELPHFSKLCRVQLNLGNPNNDEQQLSQIVTNLLLAKKEEDEV